jgi:molybdopterin converting factor subunit 1
MLSVSMAAMQLNVLYFAHARERAGRADEVLSCADGSTVAEVLVSIEARYPALAPLLPYLRVAVNGTYTSPDEILTDGAEVALIPPVSGGSDLPRVALGKEPLDLARCRQAVLDAEHGAVVCFEGVVRNHARGRAVTRIDYEAYESMAYSELTAVLDGVEAEWPSVRAVVHHRVGTLCVGDVAVIVAVGSAHRVEAFAACQAIIDRLKQAVPIWKHEVGPDGASWVSDRP